MPRGKANAPDQTTLQMALVGYELEKQRLADKIKEIQALLGQGPAGGAASKEAAPKRRKLSAAARKRIAAAQKKRWAEHRKKMAASGKS